MKQTHFAVDIEKFIQTVGSHGFKVLSYILHQLSQFLIQLLQCRKEHCLDCTTILGGSHGGTGNEEKPKITTFSQTKVYTLSPTANMEMSMNVKWEPKQKQGMMLE